jgi:hypothetical protein
MHLSNADTAYGCEVGDYVSPGGLFHFSDTDFTLEGWIKVITLPGGETVHGANMDTGSRTWISNSGTTWTFRVGGNQVDLAIVENTWTHFAYSFDASTGQLSAKVGGTGAYTLDGTPAAVGDPTTYFGYRIGDFAAGGTPIKFAEWRHWSTLRTAQEITDNYDSCIDNSASGLVSLWASANATVGATATISDETGNGNTMTQEGGTNSAWDSDDKPF